MVDNTKEEKKDIKSKLKKLFNRFLDELYPFDKTCLNCNNEIIIDNRYLCDECNKKLVRINYACQKCGEKIFKPNNYCDNCKNNKRSFDKSVSCFSYEGVAKSLIYKLKYNGQKFISKVLALFLKEKFLESGFDKVDIVTCVPSSKKRLKQRGFNQAQVLAEDFCKLLNEDKISVDKNFSLVKRIKETALQFNLAKQERKQNLIDAFVYIADKDFVKGKNILIIDDIFTTGATVNELSKLLKKYKANKVYALTVCHTCLGSK